MEFKKYNQPVPVNVQEYCGFRRGERICFYDKAQGVSGKGKIIAFASYGGEALVWLDLGNDVRKSIFLGLCTHQGEEL